MIQLDKQLGERTSPSGEVTYDTQAVLLPNHFFLNPNITCDWTANTCTIDKGTENAATYYIDKTLLKSSSTAAIPTPDEWMNEYGNKITYSYYDFYDIENNPSGNTQNIRQINYIDSLGRTKYSFVYTWDVNDNCVSKTSYAPDGQEVIIDETIYNLKVVSFGVTENRRVKKDSKFYPGIPTKEGYIFKRWLYNGSPLEVDENNMPYIIVSEEGMEILAVWAEEITLTLYSHGDVIETRSVEKPLDGEGQTNVAALDDEQNRYFDGWLLGEEKVISRDGGTLLMSEDTELIADWKNFLVVTIESEYNKNKETLQAKLGDTVTPTILNQALTSTTAEVGETTYMLQGWYDGAIEEQKLIPQTGITIEADFTAVANWVLAE